VYQVENIPGNIYIGEDVNDFSNVPFGTNECDDNPDTNLQALTHWNLTPPSQETNNYLHLDPLRDPYGLVASNLREQYLQPDWQQYQLKIRMRLPNAVTYANVLVCTLKIYFNGGAELIGEVRANQFSNNDWEEITVICFMKTPDGPIDCSMDDPPEIYNYPDAIGTKQIPNHIPNEKVTITPYDYQIYWNSTAPHNYTVDIDYIAIDDKNAHRLYTGYFDARIQDLATNYCNEPGVLNFQAWDEPFRENLFPVKKIQSLLYNFGVGGKEPLCYRAFFDEQVPNKRFLYESNMQVLLSTIYPIPYYFYGTVDPFVKPGEPNYTDILQSRLQSHLISPLRGLINESLNFEKSFWFAVQAHKWAIPPTPNDTVGQMWHREPSAYEIKAMANLAVCYGAKGIIYYLYAHNYDDRDRITGFYYHDADEYGNPDWDGSIREEDEYGYHKWETVKQLNQKLASIGDELLSLSWVGAKSWLNESTAGNWMGLISDISTNVPGETKYVETSHSTNESVDYFFTVNRLTLPTNQRTITLTIDKSTSVYNNWNITEIGTENYWIISKTGNFQTTYEPGEGKLFKLEPVVIAGGN
jgi:hypothetical protein